MTHKIISFYGADLPDTIPQIQQRVFDKFGVKHTQLKFRDEGRSDRHSESMEEYMNANSDWDFITFMDIDCVPTNEHCVPRILAALDDENTVYGNAQASNVYDSNIYKSPPFVGPGFFSLSRKVWETAKFKSLRFQWSPNPDGHVIEADVCEKFSHEARKQGFRVVMAYPSKVITTPTWYYGGQFGYPKFAYGQGTEFDESGTFHNFIIRVPTAQHTFINYCKGLLNET